MKIPYLMVQEKDRLILGYLWHDDPDAGPLKPQHQPGSGVILIKDAPKYDRTGRADTEAGYLIDGAVVWVDAAPLVDVIAQALDQIDTAADTARTSVLIKTTKAEEYMQAETQARAWKDAGYTGDAPPDVASWAAAKWREEMTYQQAAESILAQADQYRALLSGIRALRLKHMEDARHAADAATARATMAAFTADLLNLMKGTA